MLSDSQKLTIKVAVQRAREHGTEAAEVKKLSDGMGVGEDEIRVYADQVLGTAVPAPIKQGLRNLPASAAKPQGEARKGRREWSAEEIQQLQQLHGEGKGPKEIAKALGCDIRRVQSKLHNMKKAETKAQPAGEPPGMLKSTDAAPALTAPLPEAMRQIKQAFRNVFPVTLQDPVEEGEDEAEAETPDNSIDMPAALLFPMRLVHENYGDNVIRVYASNDDHQAACAFEADGTCYELKLEVLE